MMEISPSGGTAEASKASQDAVRVTSVLENDAPKAKKPRVEHHPGRSHHSPFKERVYGDADRLLDDEKTVASGVASPDPDAPSPVRRRPGRPVGAKTKPKPWSTSLTRENLLRRSHALEFLADVAAGRAVKVGGEKVDIDAKPVQTWRFPTLPQRLSAASYILSKAMPDLSVTELTGKDGTPLHPVSPEVDENDPDERRKLARAILHLLKSGVAPRGEVVDVETDTSPAETADSVEPLPDAPPKLFEKIYTRGLSGSIALVATNEDGTGQRWNIYRDDGERIDSAHSRAEALAIQRKLHERGVL